MSLQGKRCLVLNGSWFPIGIESAKNSICKAYAGRADIVGQVEGSYQLFTFSEWIRQPIPEGAEVVHAARMILRIPDVIRKPYDRLHIQKLPLNASSLFVRDGFKCWYCGTEHDLTIDHIIPKCNGGKSSWKNLITCCKSCNSAKGHMPVEKFCESKGCAVPHPVNVGCFPWLKELGKKYPDSWKRWLNFV